MKIMENNGKLTWKYLAIGLVGLAIINGALNLAGAVRNYRENFGYSYNDKKAMVIASEFKDLGAKVEDLDKDGNFEVIATISGKDYVIGRNNNGLTSLREYEVSEKKSYDLSLK